MSDIICAAITRHGETCTVDNLVVFDAPSAIPAVKAAMEIDYLLPVDGDIVRIGDVYDPEKDIYTRDGARIYPDLSEKERIEALEAAQNDTDAALMELAQMIGGA